VIDGDSITTPGAEPWNSAIVMDASAADGITSTSSLRTAGNALYGPLITYLNAAIFLLASPNLFTHGGFSVSALLVCVGFVLLFARGRDCCAGVRTILSCANSSAPRRLCEARPDASALFAFVSLCLLTGTRHKD